MGDILGGKKSATIPVDVVFTDNLNKLFDAYKKQDAVLAEEIEDKLLANIPEDMRDVARERLWDFGDLKSISDKNIAAVWKDFVKYGMPTGNNLDEVINVDHVVESGRKAVEAIVDIAKETSAAIQQIDIDDDAETIAKENGALEDKLELLQDIAEQYGSNITQKQRERYEELNQKDMDTGLSNKEEERFWELGEKIDEADTALEEFGQTYDKIILKLANGKKVEILPDDKGLKALYEFTNGYGDDYKGIEVADVVFQRVQKEAVKAKQAVDDFNDSILQTKILIHDTDDAGTSRASSQVINTEEEQGSASMDELRRVLSEIVYNVKIAHDDSDKTANKITLDESALEDVLKRIYRKKFFQEKNHHIQRHIILNLNI